MGIASANVGGSDRRWYEVGEARITRIDDLTLSVLPPETLLPDWNPAQVKPDAPWFERTLDADNGHALLSIHTWLVEHRGRIVLVDTAAGNGKQRPHAKYFDHLQTDYLARMEEAGVKPEDVDLVLLTHLHVDHVGWNTRLIDGEWKPTFPNARHIFSRAELDFFSDPANHDERNRTSFQVRADSVDPIIEAGLAEPVEVTGDEVIDGFFFHPTPGHTSAHISIALESGGKTALFPGDVMHHPSQILHPDWNSIFDAYADQSARSRRWALDFAADREATVFTSHFSDCSAGHVVRAGEDYRWEFM